MKRLIYQQLKDWRHQNVRKPLILKGARQVGKTYILKAFAKAEFKHALYLNFEEDKQLHQIFEPTLDPEKLLEALALYYGVKITPQTLLVFDECQACPQALTSLKYFYEKRPQQPIIAAGSLLGIQLAKENSFPVGCVTFLNLYPLTFFEFLNALGKTMLVENLSTLSEIEPINKALHQQLIELLKIYFIVGGMPEAVTHYRASKDFEQVRTVQYQILKAYQYDFSKHADKSDVIKITEVWDSIPSQLAKENKKFIFSVIKSGARAKAYESAINWLLNAGLVYKAFSVSTPKLPIDFYKKSNCYKLYGLDVGLMGAMARLPAQLLVKDHELFTELKGALTENYVAQCLAFCGHESLYYWTSTGEAEIDFVVPDEMAVLPLEVKAGVSRRKKSLRVYCDKYDIKYAFRASLMNFIREQNLVNYPLYLMERFPINAV